MSRTTFVALAIAVMAASALAAVKVNDNDNDKNQIELSSEPGSDLPSAEIDRSLVEAPPVLGEAPDLVNLDGWLNTTATEFAEFDGQVRIVQFWTFGCINCKRTLANLQTIYEQHGDNPNFEIVGVHTPEFDHEADVDNIVEAADRLGVVWPIALDTSKRNFRSWQQGRRFWPRTYVIDSKGQIRFDHIGEGAYEELGATVDWLLLNQS